MDIPRPRRCGAGGVSKSQPVGRRTVRSFTMSKSGCTVDRAQNGCSIYVLNARDSRGPRRRLVAYAVPCRRGASVPLRHHATARGANSQFRHKLGSGNDRVIGFARILLQQAAEKLGAGAVLRKNRSKCAARLNLSCVLARGFESMLLNATPQKRFSAAC